MRTKTLDNFDLDSFDRFGDDLCQLLLSFLPISDKIKFECVSKQWKSLIFNKQQKLIISISNTNKNSMECLTYKLNQPKSMLLFIFCINTTKLEKVLQKFKFITHLKIISDTEREYLFIEPEVLQLIVTYCKFLKRFESIYSDFPDFSKINFNDLSLSFGQRLEYFKFDNISRENMKAILQLTNNLKALHINYCKLNANDLLERRFSKIDEISFKLSDYQNMALFTDYFCAKIKKIAIYFRNSELTEKTINDSLLLMTRFEKLENLKLKIENRIEFKSSIDETLKAIGRNLFKLKYLDIRSIGSFNYSTHSIKGDLFPILCEFKAIKYLKIRQNCYGKRYGPIQSLKKCEKLKYLKITGGYFSDEEFEEYKLQFKGLSYLVIRSCNGKIFSLNQLN
jgi:hypothetical protein